MPVTISIGAPFLPMKNSDGNGTNLSGIRENLVNSSKNTKDTHQLNTHRSERIVCMLRCHSVLLSQRNRHSPALREFFHHSEVLRMMWTVHLCLKNSKKS